ncbi:MAG TPA: hypothetical protein VK923_15575 [Euzebyales bacterium]|nr:hypothetical protein [Euzebyales bacterium]
MDSSAEVTDPRLLPAVRKRDVLEHFDEWTTDFEEVEGRSGDVLSFEATAGEPSCRARSAPSSRTRRVSVGSRPSPPVRVR